MEAKVLMLMGTSIRPSALEMRAAGSLGDGSTASARTFMVKTSTKDLLQYVGRSLFGVAVMLLLMHLLGEVHGLIVTVIIMINQSAMLLMRVGILQRELISLRAEQPTIAAAFQQP